MQWVTPEKGPEMMRALIEQAGSKTATIIAEAKGGSMVRLRSQSSCAIGLKLISHHLGTRLRSKRLLSSEPQALAVGLT